MSLIFVTQTTLFVPVFVLVNYQIVRCTLVTVKYYTNFSLVFVGYISVTNNTFTSDLSENWLRATKSSPVEFRLDISRQAFNKIWILSFDKRQMFIS